MRRFLWVCLLSSLAACNNKLKTEVTTEEAPTSEAAKGPDSSETQAASSSAEPVGNDVIAGLWIGDCVPNPGNSLAPATITQYDFKADGSAAYRRFTYRDSSCESRYTKTDVDRLRAQLQADATAAGEPLTENELKEMDVLWFPPIVAIQYKMGRKYKNGLIEVDMAFNNPQGQMTTNYLTIFFDKGRLYFARVCSEIDAQFAVCGPVAGDKPDNRGKKVNFDVGFAKQE